MRYIMSDIHGCFDEYLEMLKKINFSEKDELYVPGDAMDKGSEPIKVIQDIRQRHLYGQTNTHPQSMDNIALDCGCVFSGNLAISLLHISPYNHYLKNCR